VPSGLPVICIEAGHAKAALKMQMALRPSWRDAMSGLLQNRTTTS
jgi:hypothetical protein